MQDAILNRTLRLTIVGTISVMALASLILAYTAIFDLFARQWSDAAARLVWGAGAALAALLLIYYRGELIDD
jgi:hypothetical protein